MDLLNLNAHVKLEIKEIDNAVEKVERLLALLRELRETAGPTQ